jgi:hypothetical protein
MYNEVRVIFNENLIIIQCKLLHKLKQTYDIIIFDEITSIISQFDSKLHKENLKMNYKIFINLVSMAKNTIAMNDYLIQIPLNYFDIYFIIFVNMKIINYI